MVKFTPVAIQNIQWRFYIVFAVLNAAWLPIIYLFLPETANRSLESIDELFARDGWHLDRVENGHQKAVYNEQPVGPSPSNSEFEKKL